MPTFARRDSSAAIRGAALSAATEAAGGAGFWVMMLTAVREDAVGGAVIISRPIRWPGHGGGARAGVGPSHTIHVVLIRRIAALAGTLALASVTLTLGTQPTMGVGAGAALLLGVLACGRSSAAVLVLAALSPLGAAVAVATGATSSWTSLLLLGCLTGWTCRSVISPGPAPDPRFAVWVLALVAAVVASGVSLWAGAVLAEVPNRSELVEAALALGTQVRRPGTPIQASITLAAGVLTALFVAETCRRDPAVVAPAIRLLVAGITAVAMFSLYRLGELALRGNLSLSETVALTGTARLSPLISDLNAAGSLFLLAVPLTVEWCFERGRRIAGLACLLILVAGAWLAGSRVALAMIVPSTFLLLVLRSPRDGRRWAAMALAALVGGVALLGPSARHIGASTAWTVRSDMAVVTARMLQANPWFGVGIARFSEASTSFMPPSLRALYVRENAHNQFFQVAGELGVPGLLGLLAVVGLAVLPALRRPPERGGAGLAGGLIAFVVTWLGQHPLMDIHVASAFWVAAGLQRGQAPGGCTAMSPMRWLPIALLVTLVASIPVQTVVRARAVDLSGRIVGASAEQDDPDGGAKFRSIARRATAYLPRDRRTCTLVLRTRGIRGQALVQVEIDGAPLGRFAVERGQWRSVDIVLPPRRSAGLRHRRLDLSWTPPESRGRTALDLGRISCQ